jgi:ankyrin repeat protein
MTIEKTNIDLPLQPPLLIADVSGSTSWDEWLSETETKLKELGYRRYVQNYKNEDFCYWKTFKNNEDKILIMKHLNMKNIDLKSEDYFNELLKDTLKSNNFELLNLLLSKNLKMNIDKDNLSSLYDKIYKEFEPYSIDIINLLIERKIDINYKDKFNFPLLMIACIKNKSKDVNYLIEKGVNIEIKDYEEYTPLILSCDRGDFEIVKCLVEKGANLEAKDKNRWTPLMHACKYGYFEIVKYLVEKGSNVNTTDDSDYNPETPLKIAIYREHKNIAKYLIDNNAYI